MCFTPPSAVPYYSGQDEKISKGGQEETSARRYVSSSTQRTLSAAEEFSFIGVIQQKSQHRTDDRWAGGVQGWGKGMSQQPDGEKE